MSDCDPVNCSMPGHAEFELMRNLCRATGDWRLENYDIYVTKEPCFMCTGMLINARARRILYGFSDSAAGGCGGALNLCAHPGNLWHPEVVPDLLPEETLAQFRLFFKEVRKKKKKRP